MYRSGCHEIRIADAIFEKIYGQSPYKSPTDMGVNMVGNCIIDDEAVCEASRQEIIRRYYEALCAQRRGTGEADAVYKIELLMNQEHIDIKERAVVAAALGVPGVLIRMAVMEPP